VEKTARGVSDVGELAKDFFQAVSGEMLMELITWVAILVERGAGGSMGSSKARL
jgi:hypothetical protein